MPARQLWLFAPLKPLVERLGEDFFRTLPTGPGVYLMCGPTEGILYVGKAKNLRKRLSSYRVANPERMPRRLLRLLRAVTRIELQECADEQAALAREAELLRTLKPRFNRAGTWPGAPRYLAWRTNGTTIELTVKQDHDEDWKCWGPIGRGAYVLRAMLARLLWVNVQWKPGLAGLPAGWIHGRLDTVTAIECGSRIEKLNTLLTGAMSGAPESFCEWVLARLPCDLTIFEQTAIAADLESFTEWFQREDQGPSPGSG
jgi:predicted GIY-YIG superfamily endonuclease